MLDRLRLPLVSFLCLPRRYAATSRRKPLHSDALKTRGRSRQPSGSRDDSAVNREEKVYAVAVFPAENYDLSKARTAIRESKSFAIADELPLELGRKALHVREFLAGGSVRNSFIFSIGAVVVWDVKDIETASSPQLKNLLSEIGELQDCRGQHALDWVDYKLDRNRAQPGIVDETVIFSGKRSDEDSLADEMAVSLALAHSLKFRVIEADATEITHCCRRLCNFNLRPDQFRWKKYSYSRDLKAKSWTMWEVACDGQQRASRSLEGAEDVFWDWPLSENLFEDVLYNVLDYRRRLAKVKRSLDTWSGLLLYINSYDGDMRMMYTSSLILFVLFVTVASMVQRKLKVGHNLDNQSPEK